MEVYSSDINTNDASKSPTQETTNECASGSNAEEATTPPAQENAPGRCKKKNTKYSNPLDPVQSKLT
jgi:hypothetical protein